MTRQEVTTTREAELVTQPRERRRTRHGEGIRTADGWSWLCDHCHHVMRLGVSEDVQLDEQHLLQSMDDAHWCEKKRRT